jgi:hypothetical protein
MTFEILALAGRKKVRAEFGSYPHDQSREHRSKSRGSNNPCLCFENQSLPVVRKHALWITSACGPKTPLSSGPQTCPLEHACQWSENTRLQWSENPPSALAKRTARNSHMLPSRVA